MDTNNDNDEGWIKLHRKILKSRVFQSDGLLKVWLWCLLKANHKDEWVAVKTGRGKTEVLVKRGQFIFGRKTAAKSLRMKGSTVQDRIKKLANMQNLVTQNKTHYSIISICNYDIYQGHENEEMIGNPSTIRQPTVTNKNDKNINNIGRTSVKKDADPRIKDFFSSWGETFFQKTGNPYAFSYAKEGSLIKRLLQVHSLDSLKDTIKAFFKDEQSRRRGLTIGIFYQEINRLVGMRELNPIEQAKRELERRIV